MCIPFYPKDFQRFLFNGSIKNNPLEIAVRAGDNEEGFVLKANQIAELRENLYLKDFKIPEQIF